MRSLKEDDLEEIYAASERNEEYTKRAEKAAKAAEKSLKSNKAELR